MRVKLSFRFAGYSEVKRSRDSSGQRNLLQASQPAENLPLGRLDILNGNDIRAQGVATDAVDDIEVSAGNRQVDSHMVAQEVGDFGPRDARDFVPANFAQIEIFRFAGEQMHLMATISQLLGNLIDCSGASIPAIAVDHRKCDFHCLLSITFSASSQNVNKGTKEQRKTVKLMGCTEKCSSSRQPVFARWWSPSHVNLTHDCEGQRKGITLLKF